MRIPYTPIFIDEFRRGLPAGLDDSGSCTTATWTVTFLSHFHTDHLTGLTSSWGIGFRPCERRIYCSPITKALLVECFGDDVAPYVVALPLCRWVSVPLSASYSIRCCLLPACHIPGSVQFALDTHLGGILYTGDVRLIPPLVRLVERFVRAPGFSIDHVFFDDTWLHLSDRVAAKMLCDEQLSAAFDAIRHRLARCGSAPRASAGALDAIVAAGNKDLDRDLSQREKVVSYVLRVHLHNHFGKEGVLQELARRLNSTIAVDDERYRRLRAVVLAPAHNLDATVAAFQELTGCARDQDDSWLRADLTRCLAVDTIDLEMFVPKSREAMFTETMDQSDRGSLCTILSNSFKRSQIQIVNRRSDVSIAALDAASASDRNVEYFAVLMSGWARIQRECDSQNDRLWQVPYTLHSTPAQTRAFIELLRPKSVTPLHYDRERGATTMNVLSQYLRRPYCNDFISAATLMDCDVPLSLRMFGCVKRTAEGVTSNAEARVEDAGIPQMAGQRSSAPPRRGDIRRHRIRIREPSPCFGDAGIEVDEAQTPAHQGDVCGPSDHPPRSLSSLLDSLLRHETAVELL